MYQTVAQVRAKPGLGLEDATKYSDAVVQALIAKTQAIVDAYLRQSILFAEQTDKVVATPTALGGIHTQLKRRFIVNVSHVEIAEDYNIPNFVIPSGDWFVSEEAGWLETNQGSCPQLMFTEEHRPWVKALVTYTAGFTELPNDFLEAFYSLLKKIKDGYDSYFNSSELVPASNQIKRYRTLNEEIEFVVGKLSEVEGANILDDWIQNVLDLYAMPKAFTGRFW